MYVCMYVCMYDLKYVSNFYVTGDSNSHIIKLLGILYEVNKNGLCGDHVCVSVFDILSVTKMSVMFL
jgi:hypothetical protein